MDSVWKPYVCGECGKKYEFVEILKKHLKEEHSNETIDDKRKLIDELMKMNQNLENQNIGLEMEVKASHKIIERMKAEHENFKKGKNVADKVIKNLQEKLTLQSKDIFDAKKISEENEKLNFEKETLEKEVMEIQKQNNSKEDNLKEMMTEMKILEDKLSSLKEKKTEDKNFQTDTFEHKEVNLQTDALMVDEKNLQTDEKDEMQLFVETNTVGIQCDPCGDSFVETSNINNHLQNNHEDLKTKMKILKAELESKLNLQRMKIASDILLIKEKEHSESEICTCRSYCRIFHKKHNWKRSASQNIVKKLKNLYSCNLCDKTFLDVANLNLHMRTIHGKRGKEKVGK